MEPDDQNTNNQASVNNQKAHSHLFLWIIILLLLLIGSSASFGVYQWQHNQTLAAQQALIDANKKISNLEAVAKLAALPVASDFSPQCESKNNSDLIVASLTPEPVAKYQAFIINCLNHKSIPDRVVAFKIHDDGSRTFAFGAGTGEPMCISSKIIDANAATEISRKTLIPICTTF